MRSIVRPLLAVLTAIAAMLPGAAVNAAATVDGRPGVIEWRPCPEDATAECGTLRLPVDWNRPYGDRFDLAVARRKATDPAARIGSLVVNPGGPGGSGVDFALIAGAYVNEEISRRFDIVGFDPRGVARTNPVMCSLDLLLQTPSPELAGQADFDRMVAHNARLGADCRRRTGPLFDHVDTLSVVRDVDALRAALGDAQLSYYGVSYGTLIGQEYAERYPHRVRALALDSIVDHSLGTRGFLRTQALTAQDSFDEFVKGCRADDRCALHDRDIRALWTSLLARADRGELADPFDPAHKMTSFNLIGLAFGAFYGPDWFDLADFLVLLDTGQRPAAGPRALRPLRTGRMGYGTATAALTEPAPPVAVENAFPAVFCEDWSLPVRDYRQFAQYARQAVYAAPDMRGSPLGLSAVTACLGWPSRVNNPQHRLRTHTDATLLLLNGLHDPATGYDWATNVARQLGDHAVLMTYEGWGHGLYARSPCVTGAIDRYLLDGDLPAPNSRCPAVPPQPAGMARGPAIRSLPPGPRPLVPGWHIAA